MWTAIVELFKSIFGWFKSKEDRKASREKILQEQPFREAKKKEEVVKRTDENERLVGKVDGSGSAEDKAALEEIRKRLGK